MICKDNQTIIQNLLRLKVETETITRLPQLCQRLTTTEQKKRENSMRPCVEPITG